MRRDSQPDGETTAMSENTIDLGAMRTLMAADRTLMAWIRTSLSCLSFGFAIYKVLDELQQAGRALPHEDTPRNVGLVLVAAGTAAIGMGLVEYWLTLQQLRRIHTFRLARASMIMAMLMCAAGLMVLFGLLTKLI